MRQSVIGWSISGLRFAFNLFDVFGRLVQPPQVVAAFVRTAWPFEVSSAIGIILLACTVLYVIPRTSVLGGVFLSGYLGGAPPPISASRLRSSPTHSSRSISGFSCGSASGCASRSYDRYFLSFDKSSVNRQLVPWPRPLTQPSGYPPRARCAYPAPGAPWRGRASAAGSSRTQGCCQRNAPAAAPYPA